MTTRTAPTRLRDMDIVRGARLSGTALRAQDDKRDLPADSLGMMIVRFSPFNTWYEIDSWWEGCFMERTAPGAFTKTMNERRDQIKTLFDHGYDFQIGGKILGSIMELREDSDTALSEVALYDTSYNRDLLPGLRDGAYGSSFMFRVMRDEWIEEPGRSDYNPDGLAERTIKEVKLYEAGPVTWPANPDATAGMRSLTDRFYELMAGRDAARVDDLRARVNRTRTSGAIPLPDQQLAAIDAATPTDAPSISAHPSGMSSHARKRALQLIDI